jgi:peptidoglycan/xylan/chitin deacetylase (PgdA/CDA1 family)
MKRLLSGLASLIGASVLFSGAASAQPAPQIAITFDDLPAHSALPAGETRLGIAQKIISALQAAGVPSVYGFINGVQTEREPASTAVLPAWRAAGFPLGNHTWSHLNLNARSAADFDAEIAENEPLLKAQMGEGGGDWRWLRYPFLAEGETPQKKAEVRKYLAEHGYKVAAVTMSFGDYAFNDAYGRCAAKGDARAIAGLEAAWLDAAEQSVGYYRGLSQRLYGRDIPYVLLMHLGAFDARMLPKLLELYKAHGFRFVTLPEAERDPFYAADVDPSLAPGPANLEAALSARGERPPAPGWDLAKIDQICR